MESGTVVAGTRNLTQIEAAERSRLVDVVSYDIALDLTDGTGGPGERTFRSTTTVTFTCTEPGATTFIDVAMERVRSATLNGETVDTDGWTAEKGLTLADLRAENILVVDADGVYSATGQGLHRAMDVVDKEVYLYSQFETADAQRVFSCFDQPDLKSVYTWHVTAPAHWRIVSNAPIATVETGEIDGVAVTHFETSVRMSTYVTALCAGPYHEVRKTHDGIDLGLFVRRSMVKYLDAEDIFLITEQGFDFFHAQFGVRYPLPKYDQLYVPEFNAGAMENFGCVVHGEDHYIYRSAVTDYEYENRANTILHEMAHMWFGDLVTMRWWDDLWLNESFAEWASHWANAGNTRFTDAWTTFMSVRKTWGYRQDQLSSTHPVYCEMPDMEAVEVNFDGISYAKGAAVI
jgi:aminopeptidase N